MTLSERGVLTLSSWFGLGYFPKAPGTVGTLGALPLWWLMSGWTWPIQVLFIFVLTVFSIWISSMAEAIYGEHDVGKIVIDEVVGLLACVVAIPFTPVLVVIGFLIFRLFDITKPWPIGWVDEHVSGGFGVVIDDIIAGIIGLGLFHGGLWLYAQYVVA